MKSVVPRQMPSGRKKDLVLDIGAALESIFYWRWGILDATEGRECRAERAAKDWQTHQIHRYFRGHRPGKPTGQRLIEGARQSISAESFQKP
jgi:hypothetical protein